MNVAVSELFVIPLQTRSPLNNFGVVVHWASEAYTPESETSEFSKALVIILIFAN